MILDLLAAGILGSLGAAFMALPLVKRRHDRAQAPCTAPIPVYHEGER